MNEYHILIYLGIGSFLYLLYRIFRIKNMTFFERSKDSEWMETIVILLIVLFYPIFFIFTFIKYMSRKKHLVSIFLSSSLQIFFVSVNTILISREMVIQAGICGFLLSLVWTFNIKRIAIASWSERISYCLGAGLGTSGGIIFIKTLREII